jgi:xanthine dehydrogenase accessory factor
MKEIKEIIKAFDRAEKEGKQTALATVVQVEGSSYRSPGARMLITEDGELTGAISGGCLEGDALRKAQLVMFQQKSMVVTYDTTDDDDAKFGVGLGCNGIIHILIEPIQKAHTDHPINLLKRCLEDRKHRVLLTFYDLTNKRAEQVGTSLLWEEDRPLANPDALAMTKQNLPNPDELEGLCTAAFHSRRSLITSCGTKHQLNVFVELIKPPVALVVVGAGNDAIPLTQLAHTLGWEITVIDGRADYCTPSRFPKAHRLLQSKAERVGDSILVDQQTVVVLMTHNYNYDLTVLKQLAQSNAGYVGVLGPKKKMDKMLDALKKEGITLSTEDLEKIFGPIGLDIGAESPEEIALSALAEIKAVLQKRPGTFLRDKKGPIHEDDAVRNSPVDLSL